MEINLKDFPSSKLLEKYSKEFESIDIDSINISLRFINTAKNIMNAYSLFFSKYNLSDSKFTTLMLLKREKNNTLSPTDIAKKLGVTKATITGLLDGLEKDKFIKRIHSIKDRRKIDIKITETGLKVLDEILPIHFERSKDITSFLNENQIKNLYESFEELNNGVELFFTNLREK